MFQSFTSFFSSSSKTVSRQPEGAKLSNTEGEKLISPDGDKLVNPEAPPPGVVVIGAVTEGLNLQSFGRFQRTLPDAQVIFKEREIRRALKERFYEAEGGIATRDLAVLVNRLQESKEREEEARNRIRAKSITRIQAKEAKRLDLLGRMEAKKQPHIQALAQIEDKIRRAGFKK